jgi:hypothetical protein
MAELRPTFSAGAPTSNPDYDPRINNGLSVHIGGGNVYIGLSKTEGEDKWFYISSSSTPTTSVTNPNPPTRPIILEITTSSAEPDFLPEYTPTADNAMHLHITYDDPYKLCLGISKTQGDSNWSIFDADGTHNP